MNIHEAKRKFVKKHWSTNCINIAVGVRIKSGRSEIVVFVKVKDSNLPKDLHGWKIKQKIASKEAIDMPQKGSKKMF
jgi:hypothetical protein